MRREISPYETRSNARVRIRILIGLLVLAVIIGGLLWACNRKGDDQPPQDRARDACQERVASGLDDPQRAAFSDVTVTAVNDTHWEITGTVAQSGGPDEVGTAFTCKVKHEDDKYFATYKLDE